MRFILFFLIIFYSYASEFSNKKIVKLSPSEDNFELIDLNQEEKSKELDKQKAIFNSSNLKKKNVKKNIVDKDKDFAILTAYDYKRFGFVLNKFKISQKEFSANILKNITLNLLKNKNIIFLNSQANGLYQNQNSVNFLSSSKKYKLFNVSKYLPYEKDETKIYDKNTDYIIFITLNDFFINITNYVAFKTKTAHALIEYKIINMKTKKEDFTKQIYIKLDLKNQDEKQNYTYCVNEISKIVFNNLNNNLKRFY